MRLINAQTLEIYEFFGDEIPAYAILSHTWGAKEVSFQDMVTYHSAERSIITTRIAHRDGFMKIAYTCREARKDNLDWAWIDTCCIDKTSSSELSEAINSMFEWYRRSSVCYGYLSDVTQPVSTIYSHLESLLKPSRWFTRGWTLQELIAPSLMKFFGLDWCFLGSRRDLSSLISNITRIPRGLLTDGFSSSLDDFCVAQKMSWAATRQCTRIEDTAYCLLGIFDINMPLLYGEGEKAFRRLQEEIFRGTDDHSLLAWTNSNPAYFELGSVFADSPLNFLNSGNMMRLHEEVGAPSLVTKKGLQISLHLQERSLTSDYYLNHSRSKMYQAILNCGKRSNGRINRIVLLVVKDYGGDRGIKHSGCFSRLLTRQHLGLSDREQFQIPLGHETIFLRTFRHKLHHWAYPPIESPTAVQVHVHSNEQDWDNHELLGYTGKIVTYLTDSIAVYTNFFDADNIIVQGDCFNFRMMLHRGAGMPPSPPLEARCRFQRNSNGRSYVQLSLESKPDRRPFQRRQDYQYVKLDGFSGALMSIFLRVGQSIFTMYVRCTHFSHEESKYIRLMRRKSKESGNDDGLKSKQLVHFHIHFSSRPVLAHLPDQDLTELSYRTWRPTDFFDIFEGTKFFLDENEKARCIFSLKDTWIERTKVEEE